MPHLTLEYTANAVESADLNSTLQELNQAIAQATSIGIENFKSRAASRELYVVGAGRGAEEFVHLEIAIFGGRAQAIKDEIGRQSLDILQKHFGQQTGRVSVQFTVEIRELDRHAYYKRLG